MSSDQTTGLLPPATRSADLERDLERVRGVVGMMYAVIEDLRELELDQCEHKAHWIVEEIRMRYGIGDLRRLFAQGGKVSKRR